MAPPKFHEMRFSFAEEDSEEEEFDSEDEPDDGGQGGGQVYTAHFTQKTVNCVNHLGFRVGEIGGNEELYEELEETLWVDYDGAEEEPDPEGGSCFRMLDTRHTPIFWECFDVSLEEAKGAFDESRFSHAFNVCMAITINFRSNDHWMLDTEDTAHGVTLVNSLYDLWRQLLAKTNAELEIGGGETRIVVAESIRALHRLVKDSCKDGINSSGTITHSCVYNHHNVRLADPETFLPANTGQA